ncbi:hypothetical protein RGQ29_004717 [Quercus rubra]|uniref:Uncharacterized protein n=1 Tax=Quercus rubra TaxID=3512 RepID=A0AAN7I6I1_QUERU|nr:hypothetical protein RGQ29_004717 [Quercus rubra]
MRDLSAFWVWENPMDVHRDQSTSSVEDSFQSGIRSGENAEHSSNGHQDGRIPYPYNSSINEPSEVHVADTMAGKEGSPIRTTNLTR